MANSDDVCLCFKGVIMSDKQTSSQKPWSEAMGRNMRYSVSWTGIFPGIINWDFSSTPHPHTFFFFFLVGVWGCVGVCSSISLHHCFCLLYILSGSIFFQKYSIARALQQINCKTAKNAMRFRFYQGIIRHLRNTSFFSTSFAFRSINSVREPVINN